MTNPFKTSRTRRVPGVRQLDSGRWQARYTDPAGMTRTLGTFDTFDEAKNARARVDTAVADGIYRDPVLGVESLGDYLARWFDRRAVQVASGTLAAGTLQTYRDSARIYITAALPGPAGRGRGIDLGALPLRSLSVTIVTDWYAQVLAYAAQRVNAEAMARAARRVPSDTTAARTWARSAGIKVPAAGRLSPRVIAAWRAAGAPKARPVPEIVARPGATAAATAYRLLRTVLNDALREKT